MVSIIVPVYNIESYLSKCIESLQSQTMTDFEAILVDDGSTDNSGNLCDRYAAQDSRFRVIHKVNGGLSSARNAGLDSVKGEYIMFVDGDDYLVSNAVQSMKDIADANDSFDFIQFQYAETDGSWQGDIQNTNLRICTDVRKMFEYLYQMGGVAASACTKFYSASVFEELRFREGIAHEDEQLLNTMLPKCHKVIYTDLVLYGYVMRSGSIIHDKFNWHKIDALKIMDERIDVLKKIGYTEFIQTTQQSQFRIAAMLYCEARRVNNDEAVVWLKEKLKILAKTRGLALVGQYLILYYLIRLTPQAMDAYYLIRRIFGKS